MSNMQENEFEKKMQEQMQGFGLQPSEEVWKEVEHRIRKEKKRRFIIWWPLLFLLLAGGAGGYYFLNEKNKNNQSVAAEVTKQAPNKKENTLAGDDKSLPQTNMVPTGENTDAKITAGNKQVRSFSNKEELKSLPEQTTKSVFQIQKGNGWVAKKKQRQTVKEESTDNNPVPIKKDVEVERPLTSGEIEIPVAHISKPDQQQIVSVDSVVNKSVSDKKEVKTDSVVTVGITTQSKKEKKKPAWTTGISFYAGSSSVADGLSLLRSSALEDANGQLAVNPGTAAAVQSPVRSGLSFGAGVFIQKPLSKKTTIQFGLAYNYLSTRISVGNRVDSFIYVNSMSNQVTSAGNYYRASIGNKYANQYHLAALSANLSWRIIDGKKIKINWENGIAYSRLFSSDMLHYSSSIPGYYKDNSLLSKNQFIISTGLSIPVAGTLSLQPFISHSITSVLKKTGGTEKYYTVFGLKAIFLFGK
jgi:hypothetical protein